MYTGEHCATIEVFIPAVDEYIDWHHPDRSRKRLKGMTPMKYRDHALPAHSARELTSPTFGDQFTR